VLLSDEICPLEKITIVIPTIKYTSYLDEAIASCFNVQNIGYDIFVSINSVSDDFRHSKFWNDERVKWSRTKQYFPSMVDSLNSAIKNSNGEWLFILPDDDLLQKGFLENVNRSLFTKKTLYATRINIIDVNNNILSVNDKYSMIKYKSHEMLDLFFKNQIQNHLGLFVFHKEMFDRVGCFKETGYKYGFYIDYVFHGKVIANADAIYTSNNIAFSRRENENQATAKFEIGKSVNDYFTIISDELFSDVNFRKHAGAIYKNKRIYKESLLKYRFFTEMSKLTNPTFNKEISKLIMLELVFLTSWNVTFLFKIRSLFYFSRFLVLFLKRRKF